MLENLKSSAAGVTLYRHIEQSFVELETTQQQAEKLYLHVLESLLDHLAGHFASGTEQWMRIRILQKSLQGAMAPAELQALQNDVQQLMDQARQEGALGEKSMQDTVDALLADIYEPHPAAPEHTPSTQSPGSADEALHAASLELETTRTPAHEAGVSSAVQAEAPYCDLDKTRLNIHSIQTNLSTQIDHAKQFNSALAKLLHGSFAAIRNLDTKEDLGLVKNNFLRRYAKLIKMQQDLASKFQSIEDNLNDIEASRHNLDEELSRVHRLSLTDDLTQLPNRRAFLLRLDDEISRALRFDYPLTMALIDIDNFKPINDSFGHDAGDIILTHFAQNMNVVFRYHDMASRYGGEEFAVLFPNTDTHGAYSALNKLQQKLKADPYILYKGEEIPVPTFSAGVALFNPGEDADELIKRADVAMYKAKTSGRDHIEIDPHGDGSHTMAEESEHAPA